MTNHDEGQGEGVQRLDAEALRALTALLAEGRTLGLRWLPAPDVAPAVVLAAAVEVVELVRRVTHDTAADLAAAAVTAMPGHPSAGLILAAARAREACDRLSEARALTEAAADHARAAGWPYPAPTNPSTSATGTTTEQEG